MSIQIDSAVGAGGGSGVFPVEVFTGTVKNLAVSDNNKFFVMDNVALIVVNILANATQAFPIGAEMEFLREDTGAVVFDVVPPAVLQSRDGLFKINAQYSAVTLKKIDTNEWRLIGDLGA